MPAMPGSALVVVEPELVLGGLKTVFDCAPMAFDLHQCFDRCCRWALGGEEGEIAIANRRLQHRLQAAKTLTLTSQSLSSRNT